MLDYFTKFTLLLTCFTVAVVGLRFGDKMCPKFDIKKSTIVRKTYSLKNGAEFVGFATGAHSVDCYKACCRKYNCNMVTLKFEEGSVDESKVKCFMFNCGWPSKCEYKVVDKDPSTYAVLEFRSYAKSYLDDQTSNSHQQTAQDTHTTTTSKPQTERVWSEKDEDNEKDNWYHVPTTVKPHTTFDFNEYVKSSYENGHKTKSYDNWTDEETPKYYVTTEKPTTEHIATENYGGYDGSEYTFDRAHDVTNARKNDDDNKDRQPDPFAEDFERRVFVDNNPDYPEKPKHQSTWSKATIAPTTEKKTYTQATTEKSTEEDTTHGAEVKTEKTTYNNVLIKRFNIQENKAVIPLAVGLVLSLLLLMAVIFRLKTSRRRRTKAFLTDDADYLINGMYL